MSFKVITEESKTSPEDGTIAINTGIPGNPLLEVYEGAEWKTIDNLGTPHRAAKLEDLYSCLYEKDWCIGGRLYNPLGSNLLYMTTGHYDSDIPEIKGTDEMFLVSENISLDQENEFKELYYKLMQVKFMDNEKEINLGPDFYHHLVSTRNLIDKSTIIDLYSYSENSTDYSNVLNLNDSIRENEDRDCTYKLDIAYVKSGSRFSGTLMFDPFENFQSNIGKGDVTVEVKNGCVRVFPNKEEITECIIYHCSVIYGKLV